MNPEMSHPREEEAIAYAFGLMSAADRQSFEKDLKTDSALQMLVDELQGTAASIALTAPQMNAPVDLRQSTLSQMATLPQEKPIKPKTPAVIAPPSSQQGNPWRWMGIAASISILGVYWIMTEREKAFTLAHGDQIQSLKQEITHLNGELQQAQTAAAAKLGALETQLAQREQAIEQLKVDLAKAAKANDTARTQIAMLQSTVEDYKQGVAVVVWNPEKQEGILKLERMPPVETGKDYQLWVVDPSKKTPVNAGIVKVDQQGFAKVDFKPTLEIEKANNFAISIEQAGGVPENKGPIVLLSP